MEKSRLGPARLVRVAMLASLVAVAYSCDLLEKILGVDLDGDGSASGTGTPTLVTGLEKAGSYSTTTAARDVVGAGSYAYVATYTYSGDYGGVDVIDVTNPASPVRRSYYHPSNSSYTLYPSYIAKSGDFVYVDGGSVRYFAKVGVSGSAMLISQYNGSNSQSSGLMADGTTLYYNSYHAGVLQIFDVSGSSTPTLDGSYAPPTGAPGPGCADAGYVYLRSGTSSLLVLKRNVAGTALDQVGSLDLGAEATGRPEKSGDYLYQQLKDGNLLVINIADPASPTITGRCAAQRTGKMTVAQDCAFIASSGYIDLYDVGKPASPRFLASLVDSGMAPSGISTAGDVLLISDGSAKRLRCYRILK